MTTQKEMESILSEHRAYFEMYGHPYQYSSFEPPTLEEIREAEAMMGVTFPEAYVSFLLVNRHALTLNHNYDLCELSQVVDNWKGTRALLDSGVFDDGRVEDHEARDFGNWDGGYIKKVWWSPGWIAFARDSCGNEICIDLEPGPNGKRGQLIAMEWQDGQGPYYMTEHADLTAYLRANVQYLKEGRVDISPDGDHLWIEIDSYNKLNPDIWSTLG